MKIKHSLHLSFICKDVRTRGPDWYICAHAYAYTRAHAHCIPLRSCPLLRVRVDRAATCYADCGPLAGEGRFQLVVRGGIWFLPTHKGAFRDALALRYGWPLHNTPSACACESPFTVEHTLSCPKGGYPSIRRNDIRDFTAFLMTEVCHNVAIEPHRYIQPLSGETLHGTSSIIQDGARLDVAADGFWGGRFEMAFFDEGFLTHMLPQIYDPHRKPVTE